MLSVTQGFFTGHCLPRMLLAVFVTAVLKLLINASISVSRFSRARSGANFPPIVARKISAMLGSLSFSRLNLILMSSFGGGVWRSSSQFLGHFQYQLLVSSWSLQCLHLTGSVVWPWCSLSDCGSFLLGCSMSNVWMVCMDQMCSPPSGCCNWRILGASSFFRWSRGCTIGLMSPSSSCLHPLLSLHSSHPVLQGCLSLAPGLWLLAADHRSLQCHHHHHCSQLLGHKLGW